MMKQEGMFLCPLFSGSSGNATAVGLGEGRLLVDAGKPCKALAQALLQAGIQPEAIQALLITHEHIDHVRGAGVFSRRYDVPIYANQGTWEAMIPLIGAIAPHNIRVFDTGRAFFLGEASILPFKTPHDARESVGYRFEWGGQAMGVMKDVGVADPMLLEQVMGCSLLLLEANHDPELVRSCAYPYLTKQRILSDRGHLSNENAGRALARLYMGGLKQAVLGHLSRDNNFAELALATIREQLRQADIRDEDLPLAVALREEVTGRFYTGG